MNTPFDWAQFDRAPTNTGSKQPAKRILTIGQAFNLGRLPPTGEPNTKTKKNLPRTSMNNSRVAALGANGNKLAKVTNANAARLLGQGGTKTTNSPKPAGPSRKSNGRRSIFSGLFARKAPTSEPKLTRASNVANGRANASGGGRTPRPASVVNGGGPPARAGSGIARANTAQRPASVARSNSGGGNAGLTTLQRAPTLPLRAAVIANQQRSMSRAPSVASGRSMPARARSNAGGGNAGSRPPLQRATTFPRRTGVIPNGLLNDGIGMLAGNSGVLQSSRSQIAWNTNSEQEAPRNQQRGWAQAAWQRLIGNGAQISNNEKTVKLQRDYGISNEQINAGVLELRKQPELAEQPNDVLRLRVAQALAQPTGSQRSTEFWTAKNVAPSRVAPSSVAPSSVASEVPLNFNFANFEQLGDAQQPAKSNFHKNQSAAARALENSARQAATAAGQNKGSVQLPTAPSLVNSNSNSYNNNNADNLMKINMRAPRVSSGNGPMNYSGVGDEFKNYQKTFKNKFNKPTYTYDPSVAYASSNRVTRLRYYAHKEVATRLFGNTAQDVCASRSNRNAAYKFVTQTPQACIKQSADARSFRLQLGQGRPKVVLLKRQVGTNVMAAVFRGIPMYARLIPITHEEEVFRMHKFTQMVLCNAVPHFPIMYGAVRCKRNDVCGRQPCPKRARGSRAYYLTLTEAFHGTLRQWMATDRSPLSYASAIAQLLVALSVLHGNRVRHGGLTPDNVVFLNINEGKGWWQYRLGDKDIYVRKHESLFALNNFSNSAMFGEINAPRLQPHCEVVAMLQMFLAGRKVPRIVRAHVQRLVQFATREKLDAPMFLRSRMVLGTLQNLASEAVAEETRTTNAYDRFDILPKTYKPYRGVAKCQARSMTPAAAQKRWYNMNSWGEPADLKNMLDPLTNLFLMKRR